MADEPETDWYDRPAPWSRERSPEWPREEQARPSHGRRSGRARRSRRGADSVRWQPASSDGRGRGGSRGGDDWLADGSDGDDWRDRYRALRARSRWPLAFSAAGVVVLFVGGLMLFQPPGMSGAMGVPCATAVSCSQPTAAASLPAGPGASSSASASAPASAPAPSSTAPSATAKASTPAPRTSSSSSPAPSATPALRSAQVTYSLVRRSSGGFEGQFTIVNKGHAPLKDWKLIVVLPDDHVQSSWDGSFQETGDTVTFIPPAYALSIPARGRVIEQFTATGTTLRPVSCTFSGTPC